MYQWFKRGTSSKHLSTITASTDVTDNVIEYQCFKLSFSTDSSRTAESKKIKRYNDSYLSLEQQSVTTVQCYLPNFVNIITTITLHVRTKILIFFSV